MKSCLPAAVAIFLICVLLSSCDNLVHVTDEPIPDVGEPDLSLADVAATPTPAVTPQPVHAPTPTLTPQPTPLPKKFIPYQKLDLATIYNGIELQTDFSTSEGSIASRERKEDESFRIEMKLHVDVPRASNTLEELTEVDPDLPTTLPGLAAMMADAKVSDFYHGLYKNKVRYQQRQLTRIDRLLSRHNFYDTETILELKHPESGRKVLLMQSDMDVNGDGSDGDRMLKVDQTSSTFQPWTSYRWRKLTKHPNEFLAGREADLEATRERYAVPGLSDDENYELAKRIKRLKLEIADLKTWSFLLSRADPYIVVPGFMRRSAYSYSPSLGDYAAVIYGNTIYPAIVGDVGPSHKNGEASLRICREIEPDSGVFRRAESDLIVTYIIFPGTAEKPFSQPNLDTWNTKVAELIEEVGGHNGTYHQWDDITKPPPTPTPTPTPPQASTETAETQQPTADEPDQAAVPDDSTETSPTTEAADESAEGN